MEAVIELLKGEEFLLDEGYFVKINSKRTKQEMHIDLINDLIWAQEQSSKHASVDTFAKKLFLRNQTTDLDRLKLILSVFLLIEQLRTPFDRRYDTFYASILGKDFTDFPPNLRIVSWNYDLQFEMAYMDYTGQRDIDSGYLKTIVKYDNTLGFSNDKFCIYKINGTTQFIGKTRRYHLLETFDKGFNKEIYNQVVRNYTARVSHNSEIYPLVSFAWERKGDAVLPLAIEDVKDTLVLVVIGYSFPMFNREIDRMILGSMKNLEKVYIQAPDAEDTADRFEAVCDKKDVKIILKRDVGQFVLPNEM